MAKKSANIMVRVEPEVKANAEAVMSELGVPASVVVNMLYKHIIRTGGIPFPVNLGQEVSGEAFDNTFAPEKEAPKGIEKNTIEEKIDLEIPGLRAPRGAKSIITIV